MPGISDTKPLTGPKVYVAGPYSNGDQFANVAEAITAANRLLEAGCVPFCPHLNAFWHLMHPQTHATWLAWDLAWLRDCDALFRLPGVSPGADREVAVAKAHSIPVFEDWHLLMSWVKNLKEEQTWSS